MPADSESFNMYFIGSSNPATLADLRPSIRIPLDMRFYFRHVEISDNLEVFSRARSNALGPDRIPLRHLKECLPAILLLLINIFDSSLQSGHFPFEWKRAIVRPLPKKKSASVISDFRPISILSAASKILESVAYKQIDEFVSDRGLLDDFQSGFRKGHSTQTALIWIVDEMREAIDHDCITLLVGIDHTRAFDLANIKLFIDKLRYSGFSDAACNWIESFLSGRSQVVAFDNGEISAPLKRHAGVPQGSILGSPLFSLFINDLPLALKHCNYQLYADDFVIFRRGRFHDAKNIIRRVNEDLGNISRWASFNGLTVKPSEMQAIWVGSRPYMYRLKDLRDLPDLP